MDTQTADSRLAFVISAPSGGGKTSLIKALLQKLPDLSVCVSHTTRQARPGEIHGEHYHFVSHDEFEDMLARQAMLEYAKVYEHYYGTSHKAIGHVFHKGHDAVLDIDWQGARNIRTLYPKQHVSIFLLPPSVSALKERLIQRGQDSEETIAYRLAQAKEDISHYSEFDYVVVNDFFDHALENLMSIIRAERQKTFRQQACHADLLKAFCD